VGTLAQQAPLAKCASRAVLLSHCDVLPVPVATWVVPVTNHVTGCW
jgi:hypothetical protein